MGQEAIKGNQPQEFQSESSTLSAPPGKGTLLSCLPIPAWILHKYAHYTFTHVDINVKIWASQSPNILTQTMMFSETQKSMNLQVTISDIL